MQCMRFAACLGMAVSSSLPEHVKYTISQTTTGWLLVIENPHCSLSQMFASLASARQAVQRTAFALETLTTQHLDMQREHSLNLPPAA
jgi:hypothetical protein